MKKLLKAGLILGLLFAAGTVSAADLYVDPSGVYDTGSGTTTAHTAIQAAVDAAAPEDTVNVAADTFAENVLVNKQLTLLGANAGTPGYDGSRGAESIIDGGGVTSAVQVTADGVVIDGFTVRGGYNGLGVGIYTLSSNSNVQVLNNIITDNAIGAYPSGENFVIQGNLFDGNNQPGAAGGAGIYTDIATVGLVIDGNEFRNHTTNNPVIFAAVTSPTHSNVTFSNNSIHDNFSGVYILALNNAVFSGNTITATDATGLSFSGGNSNVAINNNTITNSARGIRIEDAGFGFGPNSAFTFSGNTFSGNSEYNVRILPGGYSGNEFNTPPVITLNGDAQVNVFNTNGYVDEGATAIDSLGNEVEVTDDSESFNFAEVGTHTITYTATDVSGSTATTTRTVIVKAASSGGGGGGGGSSASSDADADATGSVVPGEVLGAATIAPINFIGVVLGAFDVSVMILSTQAIAALSPAERQVYITNTKNALIAKITELISILQGQLNVALAAQGL